MRPPMTPDERKAQIEALARAWEDCGDGREVFWHGSYAMFLRDMGNFGAEINFGQLRSHVSIDTQDATACLAILRDVYGEDVDIVHTRHDLTHYWRARTLQGYDVGVHGAHSTLSRIHAVTLALEAS